uniref:Uncharacterized protein n=1 Tax=uncultured marine virus TaxID=186617 RepID=A0A0F7LA04_9VIRU|nr:hypothetical protein [uncultured marine virus]
MHFSCLQFSCMHSLQSSSSSFISHIVLNSHSPDMLFFRLCVEFAPSKIAS